jgi:hypothetical protein
MRFIKCVGGEMSAVYETGDKGYITHKGVQVSEDIPDEVLFSIGLRRLETEEPTTPNAQIVAGPFYRPSEDGSATAIQYHQFSVPDLNTLRAEKLAEHYAGKDMVMQKGINYKGNNFDLRFRNICYMTLMLSLVNNDALPEDFTWYTTEGELVPMSKEECVTFITLVVGKVKELELKSIEVLKKMNAIDNVDDLFKFDPKIALTIMLGE